MSHADYDVSANGCCDSLRHTEFEVKTAIFKTPSHVNAALSDHKMCSLKFVSRSCSHKSHNYRRRDLESVSRGMHAGLHPRGLNGQDI